MTSNAEIAKAMAENMTHAAVPLYGKKLRLPDRGCHHQHHQGVSAAAVPGIFR